MLGGLSSGVFELSPSITTNFNNNKLNPNEVIEGIWEDSPNTLKNREIENVKKSHLESVENDTENGIIEETVDNDTGVPCEYNDKIMWSIYKYLLVRKHGKGYYGKQLYLFC